MRVFDTTWRGVILLTAVAAGPALASAQTYNGPKCLGPVCFDGVGSFNGLAEELGGPSSSGGVYGYRTKDGRAFLIITDGDQGKVGFIGLRDFAEFGAWTGKDEKLTTEDIGVGRHLSKLLWAARRQMSWRPTESPLE